MKNRFFVYGDSREALEIVMRLQSVKRWHMIDTTRQQTVAEHTANVALLAYLISNNIGWPQFIYPQLVMVRAMFHDLAESVIGDIPTHTKVALRGVTPAIDDLESAVMPKEFDVPIVDGLKHIDTLVKLCDLADGIRFIRAHGVGPTAVHAQTGLERQFETIQEKIRADWPEVASKNAIDMATFYAYELS